MFNILVCVLAVQAVILDGDASEHVQDLCSPGRHSIVPWSRDGRRCDGTLIKRNTAVPCKATNIFTMLEDN